MVESAESSLNLARISPESRDMTRLALDGRGTSFLYYLFNGHTDWAHDDHDDHPKAVEANDRLPRLRVCVLKDSKQRHQSPAGAVHRPAGFLFSGALLAGCRFLRKRQRFFER
jgi:hypothetical protein